VVPIHVEQLEGIGTAKGEGGGIASNAILTTFPNRPDPLSFFSNGG